MSSRIFGTLQPTLIVDIDNRHGMFSGGGGGLLSNLARMMGGDSLVLQSVTGPGMAFAELDGDAIEYHLNAGETLLVEPGHVAMFEQSVTFDVQTMKGLRTIIFSGEALFFARLSGPGRVCLSSMSASKVVHRTGEYLPKGS